MAKADISKTTFSNQPKQEMAVVDAYKSSEVAGYLEDNNFEVVERLNQLFPEIKADKIQKILSDPKTKEFLAEHEMSVTDLVKSVTKSLPQGVSLGDIFDGSSSMQDIMEFADNLREKLSSAQWQALDNDYFKSVYNAFNRYKKEFSQGENWFELAKNNAVAGINGLLSDTDWNVDDIMDAAQKIGITEKLLESGYTGDFIEWVENSSLPDSVKKAVYKDLVNLAGKHGMGQYLRDLNTKAQLKKDPKRAREAIRIILGGYYLRNNRSVSEYPANGKDLVDLCEELVPGWYGSDAEPDGRFFSYASQSALDVMLHDDRTRWAAATTIAFRPGIKSWTAKAKESFPFLYL